jgi:hypothetical protein
MCWFLAMAVAKKTTDVPLSEHAFELHGSGLLCLTKKQ